MTTAYRCWTTQCASVANLAHIILNMTRDEEASPFLDSSISYLTAAEMKDLLLMYIEQHDLDDGDAHNGGDHVCVATITESEVEAALEQLHRRQRDGEPLGILCRRQLRKPVAWRVV